MTEQHWHLHNRADCLGDFESFLAATHTAAALNLEGDMLVAVIDAPFCIGVCQDTTIRVGSTKATKRIHLVEVTVDAWTDEDAIWRKIGAALSDAGFDDVLYGETQPLEED